MISRNHRLFKYQIWLELFPELKSFKGQIQFIFDLNALYNCFCDTDMEGIYNDKRTVIWKVLCHHISLKMIMIFVSFKVLVQCEPTVTKQWNNVI